MILLIKVFFINYQQSLKWKQNNLDANRQNVANRLAALSASTASIVTLTSGMSHS
jgi:talin